MSAPDFAPIVSAVNFGQLIGTILGIAAAWAGVWVVARGVQFALGALRGIMRPGSGGGDVGQGYTYSHDYDDATFKSMMRNHRRTVRRGF